MFDLLEYFHISLQQFGRDVVDAGRKCIETICGFGLSALMSRKVCEGFELHPEDSSVFDYISHAIFLRERGPGRQRANAGAQDGISSTASSVWRDPPVAAGRAS